LNNQFAVTIAISMLISAFNALTLSPALAALLLRPRRESRGILARFFGGFNRGFEKVMHYYLGWSHALIRKAVVSVLILGSVMLFDGLMGKRMPSGFLPEEDYGYAFLNVQLPPAASLSRTDEVLRKIEGILGETEG
jgi:multidrug efflux pump